ncbi:MAG: DUF4136 domain-containing protein [Acidobacteriaceae bacterium]
MQRTLSFTLAAASLLTLGGIAHADSVKTDYDHGVDFGQFHTYSWGEVKTPDPFYVDRIKGAVDKQLQAKGWQMVPSGGNTEVFATGGVRSEQQLETFYNGYGGGWGGGWGGWGGWGGRGPGFGTATTTTSTQQVGHLVVDVFETGSKKLVWRGISQRNLSNKASKNVQGLDKDVQKMFKDFPPKAKS